MQTSVAVARTCYECRRDALHPALRASAPLKTGYQIPVRNPSYLLRPATWIFFIIRLATGSYWNHWAGLYVRSDGVVFVVEMRGGGKRRARRMTRMEIWQERNPDRIYEVLPIDRDCTRERLDAFIGGYDYVSLLVRQPVYLITKLWIGGKNDRCYTCSEYWARVLSFKNAHRLSPGDMAILLNASRR